MIIIKPWELKDGGNRLNCKHPTASDSHILQLLVWLSPMCELLVCEVGVITLPHSYSLAGFLRGLQGI